MDPTKLKGSYAGAIGMPQFMPSSIIAYAVSSDKKNTGIDLQTSVPDVIASVANYYRYRGEWATGGKVVVESAKYCKDHGKGPYRPKQILMDENTPTQEKWMTCNNFESIKKYNHSNKYAMAVYLLAEEIKKQV